jgi:hypothetical protein
MLLLLFNENKYRIILESVADLLKKQFFGPEASAALPHLDYEFVAPTVDEVS